MTAISQRRTPTQSRALSSCEAILDATAQLLETSTERDPPSTNRIAKRAGVSVGTLYQYYSSRDDILRALCHRHAAEMQALMLAHAGPLNEASIAEAVPAFVDAMATAHALAPRLHLALVREMLADGGEVLAEVQDPARELVLAWLVRHADEIRPRDLPAAASLLTHTVEAAIHGQLLDGAGRLEDPSWRRELVDLLLRYLLP